MTCKIAYIGYNRKNDSFLEEHLFYLSMFIAEIIEGHRRYAQLTRALQEQHSPPSAKTVRPQKKREKPQSPLEQLQQRRILLARVSEMAIQRVSTPGEAQTLVCDFIEQIETIVNELSKQIQNPFSNIETLRGEHQMLCALASKIKGKVMAHLTSKHPDFASFKDDHVWQTLLVSLPSWENLSAQRPQPSIARAS